MKDLTRLTITVGTQISPENLKDIVDKFGRIEPNCRLTRVRTLGVKEDLRVEMTYIRGNGKEETNIYSRLEFEYF